MQLIWIVHSKWEDKGQPMETYCACADQDEAIRFMQDELSEPGTQCQMKHVDWDSLSND